VESAGRVTIANLHIARMSFDRATFPNPKGKIGLRIVQRKKVRPKQQVTSQSEGRIVKE